MYTWIISSALYIMTANIADIGERRQILKTTYSQNSLIQPFEAPNSKDCCQKLDSNHSSLITCPKNIISIHTSQWLHEFKILTYFFVKIFRLYQHYESYILPYRLTVHLNIYTICINIYVKIIYTVCININVKIIVKIYGDLK